MSETNAKSTPVPEEGKKVFFFTKNYPHRWGNGPEMHTLTYHDGERGLRDIQSLEEAKALAEAAQVVSTGDNRCVTSYGFYYEVPEDRP